MIHIPLKTEVTTGDVGVAPLMFDVMAEIIMEDVEVAEVELDDEFEEIGITDVDPDPEVD